MLVTPDLWVVFRRPHDGILWPQIYDDINNASYGAVLGCAGVFEKYNCNPRQSSKILENTKKFFTKFPEI